jgi:protein gp37
VSGPKPDPVAAALHDDISGGQAAEVAIPEQTTTEVVVGDLDAAAARDITDRICISLTMSYDDLKVAYIGRAWIALGYEGWDAYTKAEFKKVGMVRLDPNQRREVVAELREAGMSTRAISSGLGISQSTVVNDLPTEQKYSVEPATVISLDGRERPAKQSPQDLPADVPAADPAPKPSPVMLTLRDHEGAAVLQPRSKSKSTFNPQKNGNIDWAGWSWNPVTGCLHGRDYCYAREIANSNAKAFPAGFKPLFRPERLEDPANTPVPKDAATDPRRGRVLCSMADLYGRWVPQEWIDQVHAACIGNPQWDYLMLTKFPDRYVGLDLPRTAWLGTSVDEQKRVRIAERAFSQIPRDDVRVRWLSLEPLRERLTFTDLSMFDWVVIGSQTQTVQPTGVVPAFAPPFEWVARIVAQAREAGSRVYLKSNLLGRGVGPQSPGMDLPRESPDLPSAAVTP